MSSNLFFLKMQQKRHERKLAKVNKFIEEFYNEYSETIDAVSSRELDDLIEEFEIFMYDNRDILTNDKLAYLMTIDSILKGLNKKCEE